ncbi:MAG: AbrB/MazE/SpoVT family DNA-binding domain-containing protein, partial [Verrucomicrobiota bacterium]
MSDSKLTQKGQITVPKKLRDALGWNLETSLAFVQCDDGVKIVESSKSGKAILEEMAYSAVMSATTDGLTTQAKIEQMNLTQGLESNL